jgi:hypothetical protein
MKRTQWMMIALVALAACSDNKPTKGGGDKGMKAKDDGQMAGGSAKGKMSMGTDKGSSYDSLTCDDSAEGVAWCDDDYDIVFCSGGEWWLLDCTAAGYGYCGDDGETVDCYDD